MEISKMKVPGKVIGFILALIGLAFGYWASQVKAAEIQTETNRLHTSNTELKEKEENLVNLYNNSAKYEQETIEYNKESEKILEKFPTFMYLEDKILYMDNLQKDEMAQYNLSEATYGDSKFVMSTSYSDTSLLELYSVACYSKFQNLEYPDIKKLINHGRDGNPTNRFVLSNITFAYNEETGLIDGEFGFSTYFIAGQNDPYEFDPAILSLLGTERRIDDLFGARPVAENEEIVDDGLITDDVIDSIINGEDEPQTEVYD